MQQVYAFEPLSIQIQSLTSSECTRAGVRRRAGPGNGSELDNSAYPPASKAPEGSTVKESDGAFLLKILFLSLTGDYG